jgi:hypothetical protein
MSEYNFDEREPEVESGFHDAISIARTKAKEELRAQDKTNVGVWLTVGDFTSPYPDRTSVSKPKTVQETIITLVELSERGLPGQILVITDVHLNLVMMIAKEIDLELGYLSNPDAQPEGWDNWIDNVKRIDVVDLADTFEPQHLPDESDLVDETLEGEKVDVYED